MREDTYCAWHKEEKPMCWFDILWSNVAERGTYGRK
jgi:hypothetical protein